MRQQHTRKVTTLNFQGRDFYGKESYGHRSQVTAADGCVILHFVFYLYFVFLLLPTWPIEPDDEPDDKFTVILFSRG